MKPVFKRISQLIYIFASHFTSGQKTYEATYHAAQYLYHKLEEHFDQYSENKFVCPVMKLGLNLY
jgi:hypothetical protein